MNRLAIKITSMEFGAILNNDYPDSDSSRIWQFIWQHRIWGIVEKYSGVPYE